MTLSLDNLQAVVLKDKFANLGPGLGLEGQCLGPGLSAIHKWSQRYRKLEGANGNMSLWYNRQEPTTYGQRACVLLHRTTRLEQSLPDQSRLQNLPTSNFKRSLKTILFKWIAHIAHWRLSWLSGLYKFTLYRFYYTLHTSDVNEVQQTTPSTLTTLRWDGNANTAAGQCLEWDYAGKWGNIHSFLENRADLIDS